MDGMTILDRAAGALRPPPSDARPATPTAATLAAVQAAGGSLLVVLVPVVLTWLSATADRAPWSAVLRLGADLWLLGQHVPLAVPGGQVSFAPLGLLAVTCAALVTAARRMARTLDPLADRIEAGATRAVPTRPPLLAGAMFVAVYAGLAALVAVGAGQPAARPDPARAALAAGALAAVCGLVGSAAYVAGGLSAVPALVADRVPEPVRGALRPAAAALAVQVVAGALLVVAALVAQRGGVASLYGVLETGVVGGVVLTLAQLTALPNLAVWGGAFLTGTGFSVGRGTSVTPAAVSLGDLPAVPVLGALPTPGSMPGAALFVLLVPLVAGGVGGLLVVRRRGSDSGRWAAVVDTLLTGLLAGAAFGVLCWLSGGGIGPGRLGVAGPAPLATGLALAAEVTVGALLVVGARAAMPGLSGRLGRD
jgi:hypothetical protein